MVSARAALAPPCSSPNGCRFPATGIVATTRSGVISVISMPMCNSSSPRMSRMIASIACWSGGCGRAISARTPAGPGGSVMASPARISGRSSEGEGLSDPDPRLGRVSPTTTGVAPAPQVATADNDDNAAAQDQVLLLLDGHSLAYRAFHALPAENFSTTTGQFTNAVYGFTSMLINLLRDERPTHVAVAFDLSRQTWRREEYVEYKATRSTSPSEFNGQVELIKEVLGALRIPWVTAENYEADDVIATLSTRAVAEGMNVKICTGDRDALQLVSDQVLVLYPRRGVSELTRFTPEEVESKYGLTPLQYPDYAALRGDPSDNLPGIPGVGEKTAAKWIREFGSLTTLVDRVDEVRGKVGDALRENLSNVLVNRRLTELVREVSIDQDPATDFPALQYDREAVHRIFDDLQFRVLRDRLLETFVQEDETSTEGFEVAGARLATGAVRKWLEAHATGRVGLVVRGTWAPG